MKMIKVNCKGCGATLKVDSNREFIFCEHCGNKILIDKEETTYNYNNGARIKEAEVNETLGKMSFFAHAENRNRTHLLAILGIEWGLIIIVGMVIIYLLK